MTAPLTAEHAAVALGVSPATVWRWAAAGQIRKRHYMGRTVFNAKDVARIARGRA